jgi:hypothetical protein
VIHADLGRKTSAEDILTSNCLGLLHLLPDTDFIGFFESAVDLLGNQLDLSTYGRVDRDRTDFWPWLSGGSQPDAIAELIQQHGTDRKALVI